MHDHLAQIATRLAALQGGHAGRLAPDVAPLVGLLRRTLFAQFRHGRDLKETLGELRAAAAALQVTTSLSPATWPDELIDVLPTIAGELHADAAFVLQQDPAARSIDEVIIAYPGFLAVTLHRVAAFLHRRGVDMLPRVLAEHAHGLTGIDIHPGATIASPFCIDHGTGVVIGETAVIGRRVVIYQGVTLGASRVSKSTAGTKRHPTIEDDVVIYANATVLGGSTLIGARSVIGGNVWLTRSTPRDSILLRTPDVPVHNHAGDEYVI